MPTGPHRLMNLSTGECLELRPATCQEAVQAHGFILRQLEPGTHVLDRSEVLTTAREVELWSAFYCEQPGNLLLLAWCRSCIVGVLDFQQLGPIRQNHLGQLGISLAPAYRGLGLGQVMIAWLIDWLKGHSHILKISVQILAGNSASIHLFQKCGFTLEARLLDAVQTGKGFDDMLLFSYRTSSQNSAL